MSRDVSGAVEEGELSIMVEETRRQAPSSRVDIHAPSETHASMAIMSSFTTLSFPKVCSRRCGNVSWQVNVGDGPFN